MSKVTRRKFLGTAALTAGSLAMLNGTAVAQLGSVAIAGTDPLGKLGWDAFLPFVNTDFSFYKVGRGGNSVAAKLVDMTDSRPIRGRARKLRQENFVLKFATEEELPLGDSTYSINHFNLGDFDLFVTRAGRGQDGSYIYTAVINRVMVTERAGIWQNRF
jgi:hypothetical protein